MSDLPQGWAEARLEDLAEEVTGSIAPDPTAQYELYSVPAFPVGIPEYVEGTVIGSHKRPVSPDDVLLCKINPRINRVWYVGPFMERRQLASTEFVPLRLPRGNGTTARYLMWYLRSPKFRDWIKLNAEGATGSHTRAKSPAILRQSIPIAPFGEQDRIVASIEEQFSKLDAGVAALERVQLNLERMRAAVHLRFDKAASVGISPQPLATHAQFIIDGDHNPPKRFAEGIPYLTAKHVKNGLVTTENATFVSANDFETLRRRYDPHPGDVLVTCVGTLGEVAVVPDGLTFAADRNIAAIRPNPGVNSAFIASLLRSPRQQRALVAGSGSTAQPHLYLKDLRALPVAVPDAARQAALLDELETDLEFMSRAEKVANTSLAHSGVLRSAILASAFSGKLLPQDPSDEPASVLLKRIAADRASSNGHKATDPANPKPRAERCTHE